MSAYTKTQIPLVMRNYFMAIMTYFEWNIEFRDLILQSSRLLNYLEGAGILSNREDKHLAAQELVKNINMSLSNKMESSFISQIVTVLTNDHKEIPDSHTFAIDELFDLYVDQFGLQ